MLLLVGMKKPAQGGLVGGFGCGKSFDMSAIDYMKRAVNRAITLGPADMLEYSFHVAKKKASSALIDLRYGATISKTEPGWKPNSAGRYMNTPTDIYALDAMTAAAQLKPDDVIVDVGCGDGFPIAYWLSKGIKNKIIGLEIDPSAAAKARSRFKSIPNVSIVEGDATVEAAKTNGTVFFLFNPFAEPQTKAFENSIRAMKPRLLYLNYNHVDQFSPEHWTVTKTVNAKPDYRQYRFATINPA